MATLSKTCKEGARSFQCCPRFPCWRSELYVHLAISRVCKADETISFPSRASLDHDAFHRGRKKCHVSRAEKMTQEQTCQHDSVRFATCHVIWMVKFFMCFLTGVLVLKTPTCSFSYHLTSEHIHAIVRGKLTKSDLVAVSNRTHHSARDVTG